MALLAQASVRATVEPRVSSASVSGWVEAPSTPSIVGTVDRTAVDQYEGDSVVLGATVRIDGLDVTPDLQGAIEITEDLDDPVTTASFTLKNPDHLPHRTIRTWTRKPCTIDLRQGPPGAVSEQRRLDGIVDSGKGLYRGMQINAAGQAVLWREAKACYLEEPLQGLTRGQILRRASEALGISMTCPDGAVYDKGLELVDAPYLNWAQDFAAPEGWKLRERDGGLQAWTPRLKTAPQPPDHVWHLKDLSAPPIIEPPEATESTWVVRGDRAVVVDEGGQETEVQTVTVEAWYTPKHAVQRQGADGTLTETGYNPPGPRFTIVSKVQTVTTKRGNQVLRQVVTEWGWHNPLAGLLTTVAITGSSTNDAGFYYIPGIYVDSDGRSVVHRHETFRMVGRRETDLLYAADGTRRGQTVRTWRWNGRRKAVRTADSLDETTGAPIYNIFGVVVADDGMSYLQEGTEGRWQRFELAEEVRQSVAYGDDGAQTGESSSIHGYFSPKATTDPEAAKHVLANGEGMRDEVDQWSAIERHEKSQSVVDGAIDSETVVRHGYLDRLSDHGQWSWGSETSQVAVQPFGVAEVRQTSYVRLSAQHYQQTDIVDGRTQEVKTFPGQPPIPLWQSSPWTQLVREPVELLLHDETLAEWFGQRTRVLQSEYIQSEEEALRVLEQHYDDRVSYSIGVERPATSARVGDTVLLIDPTQQWARRCLVAAHRDRRELWPPRATASYTLLAPHERSFELQLPASEAA